MESTVIIPTAVADWLAATATTQAAAPHAALATARRMDGIEGRSSWHSTLQLTIGDADWIQQELDHVDWCLRAGPYALRPHGITRNQVAVARLAVLGAWLRLTETAGSR